MKKILKSNKGQALFEMILFLPFLILLYTIFYTAGNSISGSINQQKAVRGYFYTLLKGNSYINNLTDLKELSGRSLKRVGFSAIGWREKDEGESKSYSSCFQFSSLLKNETTETCEDSQRETERSTRFIRIFTFYGVCGPVYVNNSDGKGEEFYEMYPNLQNNPNLCSLATN